MCQGSQGSLQAGCRSLPGTIACRTAEVDVPDMFRQTLDRRVPHEESVASDSPHSTSSLVRQPPCCRGSGYRKARCANQADTGDGMKTRYIGLLAALAL